MTSKIRSPNPRLQRPPSASVRRKPFGGRLVLGGLLLAAMTSFSAPLAAYTWPPVPVDERTALEALYRATDGEHWKIRTGWLTQESPCEWFGVDCQESEERGSFVWGLRLGFNGLRGTLPESLVSLTHLRVLDIAGNELSGTFPEKFLVLWDQHAFELSAGWNCFSNFVTRIRLQYSASGALCAEDEDVRFTLDAGEDGSATFRSVRCVPGTERDTHCLVRVGSMASLGRLGRALTRLGFKLLKTSYNFPFTGATHQVFLTTTVWWGDGSSKSVETYGRQGPIELWVAQQLFMACLADCSWDREYFEPRCERP